MNSKVFLDTGIITLFFAKDMESKIEILKTQLTNNEIEGITASPLLVEVFFQLCKHRGKDFAHKCLLRIEDELQIQRIEITRKIEGFAGELKCQFRTKLSYNDCIAIAYSVQNQLYLYTTEKELPEIPGLKVKKFQF